MQIPIRELSSCARFRKLHPAEELLTHVKREFEHSPRAARKVSRAAGIALVFLGGPHLMLIPKEPRGPQVGDPCPKRM